MTDRYTRPDVPQTWALDSEPECLLGTTPENFTYNLNATFTLKHQTITDRLNQLLTTARGYSSADDDLILKRGILKKLKAYHASQRQTRDGFSTSVDTPEATELSRGIIADFSELGPEDQKLARTTDGEPLHNDETRRYAYHLDSLRDVLQDQAPALYKRFDDDCKKTSEANDATKA